MPVLFVAIIVVIVVLAILFPDLARMFITILGILALVDLIFQTNLIHRIF